MFQGGRQVLFLCAAVLFAGVAKGNAQTTMVEHLRAEWEAERKEFGDIAAAMPADKFHFKATPEVRSFGEIVVHVVDDNMGFLEAVAGSQPGARDRFSNLKTRPDQKAMESIPYRNRGNLPRWRLVMSAIGHTKEHYGNLVTYMRLNGLVPPTTAAAQQRPPQGSSGSGQPR